MRCGGCGARGLSCPAGTQHCKVRLSARPQSHTDVTRLRTQLRVSLCPTEELAQGAERALGLQRRLEETAEQRRALRARGERCEERQRDLEAML